MSLYRSKSLIPLAGEGCFAKVDIPKGILLEWEGRIIPKNTPLLPREEKYAFMMYSGDHIIPHKSCELLYINDIIDIQSSSLYQTRYNYKNIFYNVDWLEDKDNNAVYIMTITDIKAGDELYINYGLLYWELYINERKDITTQKRVVNIWKQKLQEV